MQQRYGAVVSWSETDYLLAHAVDRLGVLIWQQSSIHRAPNTPTPAKPEPLRRPGQTSTTTATPVRLRDMVRMMTKAKGARR